MGMTLTVRFTAGPPAWAEIARILAERGYPVQMRMIDGQLAFPDETPSEPWTELRLGIPGGMVTLRRGKDHIESVVWGNADAALRQGWQALAWACALVGNGTVDGAQGPQTAAEFQRVADLPESLRS